jgi:uncharacterized protein DUF4388
METSPVFRGNLAERQLPEILSQLGASNETGSLHLQNHSLHKRFFLETGRVVFAASNDIDDRLGSLLLRLNKASVKQLEEAALKITEGKRLGTILVLQGILQPNELYHLVLEQIKNIVFSVFEWTEGTVEFTRDTLPEKEVIVLNTPMPDLILSGILSISKWSLIRKALPSLEAVYRKKEGWSPIARSMQLTSDVESLLDLLDRPRTLDEILKISTLRNFETCRAVWGLLAIGIIEEILVAPEWSSNTLEDTTDRVEPPQTRTQEMPAATAEDAGPTVKINVEPVAETQMNEAVDEIDPFIDDQPPFTELSFSDLAELTDIENVNEPPVPQAPAGSVETWEMEVLPQIRDFNEVHRYLYEMVALELGNGATNFVGKVFRRASTRYPLVFEGVGMNDFGELEENHLLANIQSNLVRDYPQALEYLISEERSMISLFLEMRRAEAIEAGLKRILNRRDRTLQ